MTINRTNRQPSEMIFPVEVVTRDLANPDAPPKRRIIDHDDHSDRVWLGKHSFWCMRNGHSVTSAPVIEGEAA